MADIYLSVAVRRQIFSHVISIQDKLLAHDDPAVRKEAVQESYKRTRVRFRIRTSTLRDLLDEGIRRDWPPLETADS
jgi:hypothetical protein